MGKVACAIAVWACVLALPAMVRADPAAGCVAERAGDRAQIRVVLSDLFDAELLNLVRLGLRGQIQLEVTLYRRRRFWFDQRRAMETRQVVVAWSKAEGQFTLDGRPMDDPGALALAPMTMRLGRDDGAHYVEVSARLEVVTVKSLGQMATWLVRGTGTGTDADADRGPSTLGRRLVSYVAADLARTASTRCSVL
jgi:hypothetical protein